MRRSPTAADLALKGGAIYTVDGVTQLGEDDRDR